MALVQNTDPFVQERASNQSQKDMVDALRFFFGEPPHPEKLRNIGEDQHQLTFYLPDAYDGRSEKLRDTISNLVLRPQTWHTQVMLPFKEAQGFQVEWNSVHFDQRILQRVPYEGASRMVTAMKKSYRDRLVRRGIALMIESDFYRSEAGRKYFADQLTSISYCVQNTCNYDVMVALLTCRNYDFDYDLSKNLLPHRNVVAAMRKEISMFAIVQKEDRGIDRMVAYAQEAMMRYKVYPNAVVLPPEMLLYVTMVPDERTLYNLGGPEAIARFEAGPNGLRNGTLRGLKVFTADTFEASGEDARPMQLLQRNTQVGEFYVMRSPETFDPNKGLPADYLNIIIYDETKDALAMVTFAEALRYALPARSNADAVMANTARTDPRCTNTGYGPFFNCDGSAGYCDAAANNPAMFYYNGMANTDGPLTSTKDPLGLSAKMSDADYNRIRSSLQTPAVLEAFKRLGSFIDIDGRELIGDKFPYDTATLVATILARFKAPSSSVTVEAINVSGGPKSGNVIAGRGQTTVEQFNYSYNAFMFLQQLVSIGVWVPIRLTIARPFIEHVMLSGIIAVTGLDTGATLFGHADMQISADTTVKTIAGHYTAHFKSIVAKEENVYIMRDAMSVAYVAGSDVRFFGSRKLNGQMITTVTPTAVDVLRQVRNRLNFQQEYANSYESMYAFLSPYATAEQYMQDNAFSLVGGSGLPWDIGDGQALINAAGARDIHIDCNFPGGINMYTRYNQLLQLSTIHTGEDMTSRQSQEFVRQGSYNNSVCLLGPHRVYQPLLGTGGTFDLVPGQGHWGGDAVPGDARWRRGEAVTRESTRKALATNSISDHVKIAVSSFS